MVARALHFTSRFRNCPFIAVACSALAPTVLESELFGHQKGGFTGAYRTKPGKFELAQGGILFLDEISETSPEIQVKLLRFLQERRFERVGGTETIKADMRVVVATNKDLSVLVASGDFRQDLYYRLKVVTIEKILRGRIDREWLKGLSSGNECQQGYLVSIFNGKSFFVGQNDFVVDQNVQTTVLELVGCMGKSVFQPVSKFSHI